MPQINDIRELAQQNARYVSNSPQDWMSYLDVAARLYRYSFTDALLIHAQRPDATACAELELWNQKMSRWVNRGAKGIALLDDTGPRTKLRYVFDIADTHLVRGGRTPLLWNLNSHEHEQAILDHLVDTYGLSQTDSMNTALLELAQQLTADNLDEAAFSAMLDRLPPEETLVVVISKSGGTLETAAQYLAVLPWLKQHLPATWQEHLFMVTDAQKGFLRDETDAAFLRSLPVPEYLGGRYSVLSAVGLVPALFLGINWAALLASSGYSQPASAVSPAAAKAF